MYNILIGGAAGQGVDTTCAILEKLLKQSGYHVFSTKDLMSRVRGGHNFTLIRFGAEEVASHSYILDGIVAFNQETVELHRSKLNSNGFILCDPSLSVEANNVVKIGMNDIAKKLGNPKVAGSISIGAILKLFGETLDHIRNVFAKVVKPEYLDINLKAVEIGYDSVEQQYPHKDGVYGDWMLLTGNQALSLGAITAGLKFYSAYPMSPSTSIMEYLAGKMTEAGIVVEQAEDEIAAINMAIGASFVGARAMTGTSGGGFCLMVEALGLSGMAEIPLVVADIQRPGPVTGLPTRTEQSDLNFVISASHGEFPRMVIALKNHADAFYQTIRAFNMAEKYQIPVIILSDQYLADSSATVEPFDINKIKRYCASEEQYDGEYLRYRFTTNGISPRLLPGTTKGFASADSDEHDERGWITESAEIRVQMMDKRLLKLKKLELELQEPEFIGNDSCETLFLGWGSTYGPIKEAVTILNRQSSKRFGALVFGDVYPLPVKYLTEKIKKAKRIINVEQNATGQFAQLIREKTGIVCTSSILKYDGRQISGEQIAEQVLKEAGK
ncbi:2-oxoglutarate ferredoxin oxidoreductase subunit alpha [Sporomusaceae bacterium BoRhaA]|uniref:2-oxoacid:acceptor oxidoreductase subunit alpha n=1 Tax=Pelorhabdus rhamnosifermentans TaxID=2772457 RepID=UPI001C062C67|nr:2-oxoacid:acceptor oxidoreductase subunit alpha [Pelorhabdus rhamnosifermentans]MBU2700069.1 2-oxoglutarate ferredoxin oxidoreductase subunit alpha [Pelorhabdus rhamnosifermentans]